MAVLGVGAPGAAAQSRTIETTRLATGLFDGSDVIHYDGNAFRRFDLVTEEDPVVYRRPRNPRFRVGNWDVAAGVIGVQLETFDRTSVLIIDSITGAVRHVRGGHTSENTGCGRSVRLDDVSPSGEVLISTARVPCPDGTGRLTIAAHGAASTRNLGSRRIRSAWQSSDMPLRQLSGDHLLTIGERRARVRDLQTGRVRHFHLHAAFADFGGGAVASDGRVLLEEWSFRPPSDVPRQQIRLYDPVGGMADGRVVHSSRRLFGQPLFCAERPVVFSTGRRGRYELERPDTGALLATGVIPDFEYAQVSCDSNTLVAITGDFDRRPGRIDVHPLSG
jgi:hypothetical protein